MGLAFDINLPEDTDILSSADLIGSDGSARVNRDARGATQRRGHGGRKPVPQEALVTWKKLTSFSYVKMQDTLAHGAPVMWHLLNTYSSHTYGTDTYTLRTYRPQNLVSVNTFGF